MADPASEGAISTSADRPALTRDQIVHTAITLVDAEGAAALSMRRLGAEMGVEAMALYRYVDGREDLLDAMVDHVSGPMEAAAEEDVRSTGGWRAYLWQLGQHIRHVATQHPHIFPLVATRHPAAPWLRPPLRNLDVVEEMLSTLLEGGFDKEQTALIYRTFASFLLGHLLLTAAEHSHAQASGAAAEEVPGSTERDLSEFPTVMALEPLLSAPSRDREEFDAALEDLLDRIAEAAGEPTG